MVTADCWFEPAGFALLDCASIDAASESIHRNLSPGTQQIRLPMTLLYGLLKTDVPGNNISRNLLLRLGICKIIPSPRFPVSSSCDIDGFVPALKLLPHGSHCRGFRRASSGCNRAHRRRGPGAAWRSRWPSVRLRDGSTVANAYAQFCAPWDS